jgi:hypothetical protein
MEYKDFLTKTRLNEKQIVLLRWISVTVGGIHPIEAKETGVALKLNKLGLIRLYKDKQKLSASLTQKGKEILKQLNSISQELIIN